MQSFTIKKNVKVITAREENSIDLYFKDISKIPLLSKQEEIDLAKLIKEGSKEALDKLVTSNLRFVISIAKQYQNKGVLLLDLINEGNIGLIHAAKTFDETRGFRFISYAVYWIRQSILAALTEQSHLIHIPFNQYYFSSKVKRVLEEEKAKGNEISDEELANFLETSLKEVRASLHQTVGHVVSLDNTLSSDKEKSTLMDVVENKGTKSPDADLLNESMIQDLNKVLNKVLDDREKTVIVLNYGLNGNSPMAFQEIGDRLGLTKECIRQVKEKALRKLRLYDGNILLKQYL